MATHANSTPAPERTLLREAAAPGRLLSAKERERELLAILDAGPISTAGWGFMSALQREAAQDGVDTLIAALDALDGDPDLEPSLGSAGGCFAAPYADQRQWSCGGREDLEEENEHGGDVNDEPHDEANQDLEPDEDAEHSLGSLDAEIDQRGWGRGLGSYEGDFDELEDRSRWRSDRYEGRRRARAEADKLVRRFDHRRRGSNVGPLLDLGIVPLHLVPVHLHPLLMVS